MTFCVNFTFVISGWV